jgi:hypothetical protein
MISYTIHTITALLFSEYDTVILYILWSVQVNMYINTHKSSLLQHNHGHTGGKYTCRWMMHVRKRFHTLSADMLYKVYHVIFNTASIYLSCTVSCQDAFSYVAAGHSSDIQ